MSRIRVAVLGVVVVVALIVTAPPGAAQRPTQTGTDRRAQTIRYWTAERVRNAVPREMVVDRAAPQAKGGPGGGGGTGGVTGVPWTKGGLVQATTGKVLFTLGSSNYVCSGSAVDNAQGGDRALVLTAGHCVVDGGGGPWATNWMFVPDFQDSNHDFNCATTPYGCWVADSLVTSDAWASNGDFNYDVAFAVTGPGGLTGTDDLDVAVGHQAIGFNLGRASVPMYAFGYPHAAPYDGNVLDYCQGTVKLDSYTYDQGMRCGMTGGSSGGPWFRTFDEATGAGVTNSLNSFKYYSDRKTMYGPYFGYYAEAIYGAANAFSGSGIQKVAAPPNLP